MTTRATDNSREREWRTEVPNIVFSLGLTPFELTLYVHLKRTAGDDGGCWKSNVTLAKETGMSTGMVIKAREGLKRPQTALDGMALITDVEDSSKPGRARHLITINDIWTDNFAAYIARRKASRDEQKSPRDFQTSSGDIQKSPHDTKKEPVEERTNEEGSRATRSPSVNKMSEEEFQTFLKSNPAYTHIDLVREAGKMRAYCATHNKQPTRRYFVAWLNRIDPPLIPPAPTASPPKPVMRCADCNENGMREIKRDGVSGFVRCKHEGKRDESRSTAREATT